MENVKFLSKMLIETLERKENYKDDYQKWRENTQHGRIWGQQPRPMEPSNAEIKRLMLMLRQETIRYGKEI